MLCLLRHNFIPFFCKIFPHVTGRGRCGTALGAARSITHSRSWAGGGVCAPGRTQQCVLSDCRIPWAGTSVVSAGASSRGSQEGTPLYPLSLGCELSSIQHQGQGGAGWALGGPPFASQPLLSEVGAEQEAWGSPAHCGDQGPVGTVAWTPLSAQVVRAPGTRARSPPASAPGVQTLGTFPAAPALSPLSLYLQAPSPSLCWLSPPPSLRLREHQPDSPAPWAVATVLVTTKCSVSSRSQGALPGDSWCSNQTPISPRAPGSPVTSWIQGCLGQYRAPAHLWAAT